MNPFIYVGIAAMTAFGLYASMREPERRGTNEISAFVSIMLAAAWPVSLSFLAIVWTIFLLSKFFMRAADWLIEAGKVIVTARLYVNQDKSGIGLAWSEDNNMVHRRKFLEFPWTEGAKKHKETKEEVDAEVAAWKRSLDDDIHH